MQRGGVGPDVPAQVLPVVIMDDNSKGPYPACRVWAYGIVVGSVAAQYSYAGILNTDDPVLVKSAVVIDEVLLRVGSADDVAFAILNQGSLVLAPLFLVEDMQPEKDPRPIDRPAVGNVKIGSLNTVVSLGNAAMPVGGTSNVVRLPGPFVIGPGQQFVVRPLTVLNAITAFFRGRYYPSG